MISGKEFKPVILELIQYYYQENGCGGYLHIALDDGNLSDENVFFCQEECELHDDQLGYLIGLTLRNFTEEERERMYNKNFWGMKTKEEETKEQSDEFDENILAYERYEFCRWEYDTHHGHKFEPEEYIPNEKYPD